MVAMFKKQKFLDAFINSTLVSQNKLELWFNFSNNIFIEQEQQIKHLCIQQLNIWKA